MGSCWIDAYNERRTVCRIEVVSRIEEKIKSVKGTQARYQSREEA